MTACPLVISWKLRLIVTDTKALKSDLEPPHALPGHLVAHPVGRVTASSVRSKDLPNPLRWPSHRTPCHGGHGKQRRTASVACSAQASGLTERMAAVRAVTTAGDMRAGREVRSNDLSTHLRYPSHRACCHAGRRRMTSVACVVRLSARIVPVGDVSAVMTPGDTAFKRVQVPTPSFVTLGLGNVACLLESLKALPTYACLSTTARMARLPNSWATFRR